VIAAYLRRASVAAGITMHMALHWKLVIDTRDAPALADFWAAVLEHEVEDQSAFIGNLLAAGHLGEDAVAEHRGRRIFRGFAAIRHPDDPYDENTGVGRGRRLLFQDVPEGKTVKNRLHIDVHSEPGGLDALVDRLESLGPPASARWTRGRPGAGGRCGTPRATSSTPPSHGSKQ
jgi:hypothetical protein